MDRLGSAALSRCLVPDLDFWVPGHRRRSEASVEPIHFHTHEIHRIIFESGTNSQLPGTKLGRSGTKGRRQPGTTHDCVKLGLRRPEDAWTGLGFC